MTESNVNEIVGKPFEEMSISEMAMVQGLGNGEIDPIAPIQERGFVATFGFSILLVKTLKGNC